MPPSSSWLTTWSNVVAVKDAAGDVAETARLAAAAPDGFEIYSGEDALTLALLAVGAVGVVSVASHWATPETVVMMNAFFAGDVALATETNQRLVESWDFESGDLKPNPLPTKAMLKVLGLPGGDCRPPMGPEPEGLQDLALQVLAGPRSDLIHLPPPRILPVAVPVHLTFFGGLGEIGRNCAALEAHGRIVMLDCGQLFPDDMPGVDAVLPDFDWLLERADRLEACVVTHAHEDHIGGLPYLLRALGERGATLPIYGSPFTLGMIRGKLKFAGVPVPDLIPLGRL